MVMRRVSSLDAGREFDQILSEVTGERSSVIVEQNGEAVAAVVPIDVLRQFEVESEQFFLTMKEASERANLTDEEAMEIAIHEIAAYRLEQSTKTGG